MTPGSSTCNFEIVLNTGSFGGQTMCDKTKKTVQRFAKRT
jgi:hypothetical protein